MKREKGKEGNKRKDGRMGSRRRKEREEKTKVIKYKCNYDIKFLMHGNLSTT